jgi:hypothetical protein
VFIVSFARDVEGFDEEFFEVSAEKQPCRQSGECV